MFICKSSLGSTYVSFISSGRSTQFYVHKRISIVDFLVSKESTRIDFYFQWDKLLTTSTHLDSLIFDKY